MADQGYNIDDPQNLNTFLALIGGSQVPSSSEPSRSTASQQTPSVGLAEPETASNSFKVSLGSSKRRSSRFITRKNRIKTLLSQIADLNRSHLRRHPE